MWYVVIWHIGSSERFSDFVLGDSYILGVISVTLITFSINEYPRIRHSVPINAIRPVSVNTISTVTIIAISAVSISTVGTVSDTTISSVSDTTISSVSI